MPEKSSIAPASWCVIGARRARSGLSCSTISPRSRTGTHRSFLWCLLAWLSSHVEKEEISPTVEKEDMQEGFGGLKVVEKWLAAREI